MDVKNLLLELCEDPAVLAPDVDLIDGGWLDSCAFISLFSAFADEGLELYPTRIDRDKLRTVTGIEQLVAAAQANAGRMRV